MMTGRTDIFGHCVCAGTKPKPASESDLQVRPHLLLLRLCIRSTSGPGDTCRRGANLVDRARLSNQKQMQKLQVKKTVLVVVGTSRLLLPLRLRRKRMLPLRLHRKRMRPTDRNSSQEKRAGGGGNQSLLLPLRLRRKRMLPLRFHRKRMLPLRLRRKRMRPTRMQKLRVKKTVLESSTTPRF